MDPTPSTPPAAPPPAGRARRWPLPEGPRHRRRPTATLAACIGALLAAAPLAALPPPTAAGYVASVLADSLDDLRGPAFGHDGALYATEAGVPVAVRAGPSTTIRGDTFVPAIRLQGDGSGGGGAPQAVLAGLPSLSSATTGTTAGAQDIAFDPASGRGYVAVGLGAAPGRAT